MSFSFANKYLPIFHMCHVQHVRRMWLSQHGGSPVSRWLQPIRTGRAHRSARHAIYPIDTINHAIPVQHRIHWNATI